MVYVSNNLLADFFQYLKYLEMGDVNSFFRRKFNIREYTVQCKFEIQPSVRTLVKEDEQFIYAPVSALSYILVE